MHNSCDSCSRVSNCTRDINNVSGLFRLNDADLIELFSCHLSQLGDQFAHSTQSRTLCEKMTPAHASAAHITSSHDMTAITMEYRWRFERSLDDWVKAAPSVREKKSRADLRKQLLQQAAEPSWPDNVRALELGFQAPITEIPKALCFLVRLEHLQIYGPVQGLSPEMFDNLQHLESLHLSLHNFSAEELPVGLFSKLTNLKTLCLRGMQLSRLSRETFQQLDALETLELKNVDATVDADALLDLSHLREIRFYDVDLHQYKLQLHDAAKLQIYNGNRSVILDQDTALEMLQRALAEYDERFFDVLNIDVRGDMNLLAIIESFGIFENEHIIAAMQVLATHMPTLAMGTASQDSLLWGSISLLVGLCHIGVPIEQCKPCEIDSIASFISSHLNSIAACQPMLDVVFECLKDRAVAQWRQSEDFDPKALHHYQCKGFPQELKQAALQLAIESSEELSKKEYKAIIAVLALFSYTNQNLAQQVASLEGRTDSYADIDRLLSEVMEAAPAHIQQQVMVMLEQNNLSEEEAYNVIATMLLPEGVEPQQVATDHLQLLAEPCKKAILYRNDMLSLFCLTAMLACNREVVAAVYGQQGIAAFMQLPLVPIAKWLSQAGLAYDATRWEPMLQALGVVSSTHSRSHFKRHWNDKINGPIQSWLLACKNLDDSSLEPVQKLEILNAVCCNLSHSDQFGDLKRRLSLIGALDLSPLASNSVTQQLDETSLRQALLAQLRADDYLNLGDVAGLDQKYFETLGNMRVPDAWCIYQKQICQTQDSNVQGAYQKIIRSILSGDFRSMRYAAAEQCAHGRALLEIDALTWQKWQQPVEAQLITLGSAEEQQPLFLEQFLAGKIRHHHLSNDRGETLEHLIAFLEADKEQRDVHIEQAQRDLADPTVGDTRTLQIELQLMELCKLQLTGRELADGLSQICENVLAIKGFELGNDLKALKACYAMDHQDRDAVLVVDTDDWQDLFLCGTEVVGSCQRVDGLPSNNKCLLAYLLDGKNRMLAVKDPESGAILARSIFRLLIDSNNKLVLFQECIYPEKCSGRWQHALNDLAKRRALALGLPLYRDYTPLESEPTLAASGSMQPDALISLGSPAPWEYGDAGKGVAEDGIFEISSFSLC